MLDNTQKVIFATYKKYKAELISKIVGAINPTSFRLHETENRNPKVFKDIFDLQEFLRKLGTKSLSDTLLILDCDIIQKNTLEELAEIFLIYPELKIKVFIDSELVRNVFQIPEEKLERCDFIIRNIKNFIEAGCSVNDGNMIFDPSGIRNQIKMRIIESIGFETNNYAKKQKSRKENFGISIDHDPYHALFIGYALYNFGYSVLPVVSYKELEYLSRSKVKANIICRECDLQFHDMLEGQKDDYSDQLFKSRGIETDGEERKIIKVRNDLYDNILEEDKGTTWFVTQYKDFNSNKIYKKIVKSDISDIKYRKKTRFENPFYVVNACKKTEDKKPEFKRFGIITEKDAPVAFLRGQRKVIKGIHNLLNCSEVKKVYNNANDICEVNRLRKEKKYHDKTAVNLNLARKMIHRAKKLFSNDKILESAILACDALELSNGLSMILSLEILNFKIKAETKLELMISGIGILSKHDIKEKIRGIKINVSRVCKNNDEAKKSTLMQYFNILRLIYQDFEQFEVAETLYSEVLKIEGGIIRYSDHKMNRKIKKVSRIRRPVKNRNHSEKKDTSTLSQLDKFQIILKTFGCNFNFLWCFILIFVLILDYCIDSEFFPICYFGILLGFCSVPKRAIYTIIGSGVNVKRFISSFLIFQFAMVFIYLFNYDYSKIPYSLRSIGCSQLKLLILRNTFLSSFINQPSVNFDLLMENQNEFVHWLITGHMAITVIFLGIFISAIYRWVTKR